MKTADKITNLIRTLSRADSFSACIVEGDPGWGKTTAVGDALVRLNIDYVHLGSYATPLGLFNFLFQNSGAMIRRLTGVAPTGRKRREHTGGSSGWLLCN